MATYYYIWEVNSKGNLSAEPVARSTTLKNAKINARIGAVKGHYARAVTKGDEVVRIYAKKSGERLL